MKVARLDSAKLAKFLGDANLDPAGPPTSIDQILLTLDVASFFQASDLESGGELTLPSLVGGIYGRPRRLALPNPAAGADISFDVPTGRAWLLRSLHALLTCDATVATRLPRLFLGDSSTDIMIMIPGIASATASQAIRITWASGINSRQSSGGLLEWGNDIPAPIVLPAPFNVRTSTSGLVAGDQYSGVRIFVEEFALA